MSTHFKPLKNDYGFHYFILSLMERVYIFNVNIKKLDIENWLFRPYKTIRDRDFQIELDLGDDIAYIYPEQSPLIYTNYGVISLTKGPFTWRSDQHLEVSQIRLTFYEFSFFNHTITPATAIAFFTNFEIIIPARANKRAYIPIHQPDAPTLYTCYSTYPDGTTSQCPFWHPNHDGTISCLYSGTKAFDQMAENIKTEDVHNTPDDYFYLWDEISGDCRNIGH